MRHSRGEDPVQGLLTGPIALRARRAFAKGLLNLRGAPRPRTAVSWRGERSLKRLQMQRAEKRLDRLLRGVSSRCIARDGFVRRGKPWKEILSAAEELEIELISLGSSGHSVLERLLLGSTAENVVRRSPVPVLVSRGTPFRRVRRLLVPVDFKEGSMTALRFALERFPPDVKIVALSAIPPVITFDPQIVNYYADRPRVERDMRSPSTRTAAQRARHEVAMSKKPRRQSWIEPEAGGGLDPLVHHARSGRCVARFMLGSVAEKVIRYAEGSVLVLPGPSNRRAK